MWSLADYLLQKSRIYRWAAATDATLVFSFGGGAATMTIAHAMSRRLDLPLVLYFTDDWPTWLYSGNVVLWPLRALLLRAVKVATRDARLVMCISNEMAEEYASRFGARTVLCMDGVDLAKYPAAVPERNGTGTILRYIGILEPARWRPLLAVARVVRDMVDQGREVALEIYCPDRDVARYGAIFAGHAGTRVVGSVSLDEVPRLQQTADILCHVEAAETGPDIARTRLSVSTKIPQYLAAGRPILAVGPRHLASMQYLARTSAAVLADSSEREISAALLTLLDVPDVARRMGEAGRAIASQYHDLATVGRRFRSLLESAGKVL